MNHQLPKLFARAKTGAIQEWSIEVQDGKYRTLHGQVGGKIEVTQWTQSKTTNKGKSNQRTSQEQAFFDAEVLWKKKKALHGYFEDIKDVDKTCWVEPMLALHYKDAVKKGEINFPVFVQYKMDGCLHKDTVVETDKGSFTLETLYNLQGTSGFPSKIKSFNTENNKEVWGNIANVFKNGTDMREKAHTWYELTLENGSSLKVTGNHRVWVENLRCWRRVEDLDGSEILTNLS